MIKRDIVARRALNGNLTGDTFQIAALASKAKQTNPKAIDGTVGQFKYNNHEFIGFKTVNKVLASLNDNDKYAYAKSDGTEEYKKAVLSWVFGDDSLVEKTMNAKVVATPGGTGALSTAIYNSLDYGETILIPRLRWNPYVGIAETKGLVVKDYNYLKNNSFDLEELKNRCLDTLKNEQKIVIILNDPCNNPTGYSLKEEELDSLVNMLNTFKNIPINLIYDIAYMDYLEIPHDKIRERFNSFTNLNDNITLSVCFSASKSFCMYGLRVGAVIYLSKNQENAASLYKASNYYNRHTWSNPNRLGLTLVEKIVNNKENKLALIEEINEVKKILLERFNVFKEECDKEKLLVYPYSGGFFTAVNCDDPQKLMEKLFTKDIFLLNSSPNTLRVAICSISLDDIYGLSKNIKEEM